MIKRIKDFIIRLFPSTSYSYCYSEMEHNGYAVFGCCGGLVGGIKATDYLQDECVSCPYLVEGCDPRNN